MYEGHPKASRKTSPLLDQSEGTLEMGSSTGI